MAKGLLAKAIKDTELAYKNSWVLRSSLAIGDRSMNLFLLLFGRVSVLKAELAKEKAHTILGFSSSV